MPVPLYHSSRTLDRGILTEVEGSISSLPLQLGFPNPTHNPRIEGSYPGREEVPKDYFRTTKK